MHVTLEGAAQDPRPASASKSFIRKGGLLQAIAQQIELHRAAFGVGSVEQRQREARALELRDFFMEPRHDALTGGPDPAAMIELARQRLLGPQITPAGRIVRSRFCAAFQLRHAL